MDIRSKLIELLRTEHPIMSGDVTVGVFQMPMEDAEGLAGFLIANGVTITPDKPEKPPTDLRGKCGGCAYAVTVPACGSTFAYVQCTNPQHLATYGKKYKSGIRQRTTKACKKYLQKEGL